MNDIEKAVEILNSGSVVAMPTETVYGLAGNIEDENSIRKIFETKNRPFFDPLIVHVSSEDQAKLLTDNWNQYCHILADKFWPGPLTIVVPKSHNVNPLITAGLESVGIRLPSHNIAQELISHFQMGLAAPSANKFKQTSPTCSDHVREEFGDDVFVLEGGHCEIGIESTVIGVFDDKVEIYRPGMITQKEIQDCLDIPVKNTKSPVAPGHLEHHYMPKKPLVQFKDEISKSKIKKAAKELKLKDERYGVLILDDDVNIAARQLYSQLRSRDLLEASFIAFAKEEKHLDEKWIAIFDRLDKATTLFL
jgi:L-threonylcarbamoyladenylate synthase